MADRARIGPVALSYACSIMQNPPAAKTIELLDPVSFTRRLCEIESTTYGEGAVGDFLAEFLAGRGWSVEKTPVPQPSESAIASPRWNVYAGTADQSPDL